MRTLVCCLLAACLFNAPCDAQVLIDSNDPRIQFDPKKNVVAKIPEIIAMINDMQKALEQQLSEADRNSTDLANLQTQLRNLSLDTQKHDAQFPASISEALRTAATEDDKVKIIRDNRTILERLVPAMRSAANDYTKLKQIFPSTRRPSSAVSPFMSDIIARATRQIEEEEAQCELRDVLTVINRNLDDTKSYRDVEFTDKADLMENIQKCSDFKNADASQLQLSIMAAIDSQASETKLKADRLRTTRNTLYDLKNKWENQLRRATEISNSLIDWTIPLLALSVVLMLAIPRLYSAQVQLIVLSNGIILEVFTVFLLITTVLLLGIADRIQSEALGTLLGGISGYVLGRSALRTKTEKEDAIASIGSRDPAVRSVEKVNAPFGENVSSNEAVEPPTKDKVQDADGNLKQPLEKEEAKKT